VPSNQQRREAAKRKLERQLVRRAERQRQQRTRLTIVGAVVAVLIAGGVVWLVTRPSSSSSNTASGSDSETTSTGPTTPCSYPTDGVAAAVKKVSAPTNLYPANTGTVDATITMNGQPIQVTLDRKTAPCAVEAFVSLAAQGFYNDTSCWRLTASPLLNILQCGDPSGAGNGGPGYTYADESTGSEKYTRGVVAMANAGTSASSGASSSSNGSQFFIVYKDSVPTSASYTIIGKVSDAGMKVVDDVAAKGIKGGGQTGAPNAETTDTAAPTDESGAVSSGATDSSGASVPATSTAASTG
jgi:peptidyl-prolyl cis-trans isomerase B (cyclophilin B)